MTCDDIKQIIREKLRDKGWEHLSIQLSIHPNICEWFGGNMELVDKLIELAVPINQRNKLGFFDLPPDQEIKSLRAEYEHLITEVVEQAKASDLTFQQIINRATSDRKFRSHLLNWANPDASETKRLAANYYLLHESGYKETHFNKLFQVYVYFTQAIPLHIRLWRTIKEGIPGITKTIQSIIKQVAKRLENEETWFWFAWIALTISALGLILPSVVCFLGNPLSCESFSSGDYNFSPIDLFNAVVVCFFLVALGIGLRFYKNINTFDKFLITVSWGIYFLISLGGWALQQNFYDRLRGYQDWVVGFILIAMVVVFYLFLFHTQAYKYKSFIPILFFGVLFAGLAQIALGFPFRYIQNLINVLIFSLLAFVFFHQASKLTEDSNDQNAQIKEFLKEIGAKDYLITPEIIIRSFALILGKDDDEKIISWQRAIVVIVLFGFGISLFFNLFSTQTFPLNGKDYILYPSWMADRDFGVFYVVKNSPETDKYTLHPSAGSAVYISSVDAKVATDQVQVWELHTLHQNNASQGFWAISIDKGDTQNSQELHVQRLKLPFGIRGYLESQPFFTIAGLIYGVILTLLQFWVGIKASTNNTTSQGR